MLGPVAPRIPQAAAVIVAEAFGRACLREGGDDVEHSLEHGVVGWGDFESIARLEQARIEEEVERVDVVIERLLEVHSIGTHLALRFVQHNFPGGFSPARGALDLGIQSSEKKQGNRFSQQMRVRRKIGG